MPDKPKVYLAGPIQYSGSRGKGWRQIVKSNHDTIEWIDPIDKYDSGAEAREWEDEKVVEEDLKMIDNCDAILVHWEIVPTCGTPMEIFYASRVLDVPVIVQTTAPDDDLSPWLTAHTDRVVETFSEAVVALHEEIGVPA